MLMVALKCISFLLLFFNLECNTSSTTKRRLSIATELPVPLYGPLGIVGGQKTTIKKYPFAVQIIRNGGHVCGGSLLTEKHVLSAAHCYVTPDDILRDPSEYTVRLGSTYLYIRGSKHDVSRITVHEWYRKIIRDNDIAILEVIPDVEINSKTIDTVTIPTQDLEVPDNAVVTVVGWGLNSVDPREKSDILHEVQIYTVNRKDCRSQIINKTDPDIEVPDDQNNSSDINNNFTDTTEPDRIIEAKNKFSYGNTNLSDPNNKLSETNELSEADKELFGTIKNISDSKNSCSDENKEYDDDNYFIDFIVRTKITYNMICAGFFNEDDGGKGSCKGDSGGPLLLREVQVGIVSFGRRGCNHSYPGVYTNVAAYTNWIHDVVTGKKVEIPEDEEPGFFMYLLNYTGLLLCFVVAAAAIFAVYNREEYFYSYH